MRRCRGPRPGPRNGREGLRRAAARSRRGRGAHQASARLCEGADRAIQVPACHRVCRRAAENADRQAATFRASPPGGRLGWPEARLLINPSRKPQMSDQQIKSRPRVTNLLPAGWPAPKGYANGVKTRGDLVFVAGQVGWDADGRFARGFVPQARKALQNVVEVLASGGAGPEHVVRMTWYVTNIAEYRTSLAALGDAYRDVMGRNFPTMTLVEVKSLAEPEAVVEIEATAVVPD